MYNNVKNKQKSMIFDNINYKIKYKNTIRAIANALKFSKVHNMNYIRQIEEGTSRCLI